MKKYRYGCLSERKKIVLLHPKREGISFANNSLGYGVIGNTTDSGPVFPGSSPGTPTKNSARIYMCRFSLSFFIVRHSVQHIKNFQIFRCFHFYQQYFFNICLNIGMSETDANNCIQERTFIASWSKISYTVFSLL